MFMFNHDDIVYLAGIIDGEGSILIEIQTKRPPIRKIDYYAIRLLVVNTNLELMNWLENKFKGKVHKRKKVTKQKQCYVWNIFSLNAGEILKECLPYMIIKKQHAEIVLEFLNCKPKEMWNVSAEVQEHRKFLYFKLRELTKAGDDPSI